jgi:hypothetical protein
LGKFYEEVGRQLTLFVRMLAWLHATPRPPEGSKREKNIGASKLSRLETLKRDGISPTMPPNPAPALISRLIEIGLTEATGAGPAPLSWREILAWQTATEIKLPPWQARLMRNLSAAYLAESRRAESETCPPPWRAEVTKREQDVELQRLRLVLG